MKHARYSRNGSECPYLTLKRLVVPSEVYWLRTDGLVFKINHGNWSLRIWKYSYPSARWPPSRFQRGACIWACIWDSQSRIWYVCWRRLLALKGRLRGVKGLQPLPPLTICRLIVVVVVYTITCMVSLWRRSSSITTYIYVRVFKSLEDCEMTFNWAKLLLRECGPRMFYLTPQCVSIVLYLP